MKVPNQDGGRKFWLYPPNDFDRIWCGIKLLELWVTNYLYNTFMS